jgi:hypothetical protein
MGRTGSAVEYEDGAPDRLTDPSIVETLAPNPDVTVAVGESHARAFCSAKNGYSGKVDGHRLCSGWVQPPGASIGVTGPGRI